MQAHSAGAGTVAAPAEGGTECASSSQRRPSLRAQPGHSVVERRVAEATNPGQTAKQSVASTENAT
jgi:hypothetical protein